MLDAIGLSRSTYYYELSKTDKVKEQNANLSSEIVAIFNENNCYDNCIMETFFGRLKNEMFYGFEKNYPSFEAFSKAIADYIDYYNNSRIQAKTKWMPPSKFREASMAIT